MKGIKDIRDTLDMINGFRYETSFDGGRGIFTSGHFRGMTVIWSFGGGWEHVSIDGKTHMPSWEDMCYIKDLFWNEDECVVQYHPPKSEYVNNIPYCLHLWKPIEKYVGTIPIPNSLLVGIKGVKLE